MKIRQYSHMIFIVVVVLGLVRMPRLVAQEMEGKAIVGPASAAKFDSTPNGPECFTVAVERGDPGKGPSVILAKFALGCVAPFHWHTPSETVMIVSGSLQTQMKDDKAFVARHGDFVYMPPRHIHRATCLSSNPCLVFLTSDAAFDIHWVDGRDQEISLEAAMKAAKAAKALRAAKP